MQPSQLQPHSLPVALSVCHLWKEPMYLFRQSQCQTALTSGGPAVNELKSVECRDFLVPAGNRYVVAAVGEANTCGSKISEVWKLGLTLKVEMWPAQTCAVACDSWRPSAPSIPSAASSRLLGWGARPVSFVQIQHPQGSFVFYYSL